MEDKRSVRQRMRVLKAALTSEEREDAARRIFERLERLPVFVRAGSILLYHALPDEVPTETFIEKWCGEKTVLLPKVEGDLLKIGVYRPGKLKKGSYGIAEPAGEEEIAPGCIDLIVVPAVAYDRCLNRLGRGKGYYDRLLADVTAPCIGICYDCQLVERLPVETHDCPVDGVITPSGMIVGNRMQE